MKSPMPRNINIFCVSVNNVEGRKGGRETNLYIHFLVRIERNLANTVTCDYQLLILRSPV